MCDAKTLSSIDCQNRYEFFEHHKIVNAMYSITNSFHSLISNNYNTGKKIKSENGQIKCGAGILQGHLLSESSLEKINLTKMLPLVFNSINITTMSCIITLRNLENI